MQFWKVTYQKQKKTFSKYFNKNDTYIPFVTQILGAIKNLTLFQFREKSRNISKFLNLFKIPKKLI